MKRLAVAVLAVALLCTSFVSVPSARAMTPEQQQAYDAWYQARFGTPSQPSTSVTRPVRQAGSIEPVEPSAFERGVFELLNSQRIASGVAPLRLDPKLVAVARVKGEDMVENNYYGHGSSYGYSGSMLKYFGIDVRLSRENICQASSALMAHNSFMGSSSHRDNMLKPYWTSVGIGVVKKPGSSLYYVVEIFVQ